MAKKQGGTGRPKGSAETTRAKSDRVVLKLSLDRETARLIRLEAFGRDCSVGQVVEELVRSSPRRFYLVDRAKGSQVVEGPANPGAEAAPVAVVARPPLGVVSGAG